MINQWLSYYKWRLLNPIIPCAICKIPNTSLVCNGCFDELEINQSSYCNYCAKPGPPICTDCNYIVPAFSHTYCDYIYAIPLNKMLHHIKYKHNKSNVWALGSLLSRTLSRVKIDTDFIIPIPLSGERLAIRGFNQVSELLKHYCVRLGHIPVKNDIVDKIIDTAHYAALSRQERYVQKPVFQVKKNVVGKNILIVDDVITTGSTANTLANTLLSAGAKRVELCALMRTVSSKNILNN